MISPGNDRQIGSFRGLRRSVGTTWGHQVSNRLATLVDLRRPVRTPRCRCLAPRKLDRSAAFIGLCVTVGLPWGRWGRNRLAALVDLCRTVAPSSARICPKLRPTERRHRRLTLFRLSAWGTPGLKQVGGNLWTYAVPFESPASRNTPT